MQRFSEGSSSSSDTVETISTTEHYVLVCVALLLRCLQVCGCSAAATLQCVACTPNKALLTNAVSSCVKANVLAHLVLSKLSCPSKLLVPAAAQRMTLQGTRILLVMLYCHTVRQQRCVCQCEWQWCGCHSSNVLRLLAYSQACKWPLVSHILV